MFRKINVMKGDIMFQWKYGFYTLYFLIILIYSVLFSFFGGDVKNTIVSICVYSDPAAMGMFFMGAMILLEKSQKITNSQAVSPMNTREYILGKILSIGLISEIVGVVLMSFGETKSMILCVLAILGGSVIFSLCGIIVGTKIHSLNQYIIWTIPFEIVGFVPVILYRMGFLWENRWMLVHPGCSVMQLMEGNTNMAWLCVISILVWSGVLFWIADVSVQKMFRLSGNGKGQEG